MNLKHPMLTLTARSSDEKMSGLAEWGIEGEMTDIRIESTVCPCKQVEILAAALHHLGHSDHLKETAPTLADIVSAPHKILSELNLRAAAAEPPCPT